MCIDFERNSDQNQNNFNDNCVSMIIAPGKKSRSHQSIHEDVGNIINSNRKNNGKKQMKNSADKPKSQSPMDSLVQSFNNELTIINIMNVDKNILRQRNSSIQLNDDKSIRSNVNNDSQHQHMIMMINEFQSIIDYNNNNNNQILTMNNLTNNNIRIMAKQQPTISINNNQNNRMIKCLHRKRLQQQGYRMTNKKLGEGGYGSVYKIYPANDVNDCNVNNNNHNNGRAMACKIMLMSNRKDKLASIENFAHEIFTLQRGRKHRNIIHLDNYFIYNHYGGHYSGDSSSSLCYSYIIMEYACCGTLWAKLKKYGPFNVATAVGYFRQIVDAICYLHSIGIAHRDLKLGNILLTTTKHDDNNNHYNDGNDEIVKIADFGLSRLVNTKQSGLIRFDKPAGTLAYMSPQILSCYIRANTVASDNDNVHLHAHGNYRSNKTNKHHLHHHSYDAFKSDVWALAVCLYLLLAKQHPFDNPPPNKDERIHFARKMLDKQMNCDWRMPFSLTMNQQHSTISSSSVSSSSTSTMKSIINNQSSSSSSNGFNNRNSNQKLAFLLNRMFEPNSHHRINIYDVNQCINN